MYCSNIRSSSDGWINVSRSKGGVYVGFIGENAEMVMMVRVQVAAQVKILVILLVKLYWG